MLEINVTEQEFSNWISHNEPLEFHTIKYDVNTTDSLFSADTFVKINIDLNRDTIV